MLHPFTTANPFTMRPVLGIHQISKSECHILRDKYTVESHGVSSKKPNHFATCSLTSMYIINTPHVHRPRKTCWGSVEPS